MSGKYVAYDTVTGYMADPRVFDSYDEADRARAQTGGQTTRVGRVVDPRTFARYEILINALRDVASPVVDKDNPLR